MPARESAGIGRRFLSLAYESLLLAAILLVAAAPFLGTTTQMLSGLPRHIFQLYLFLVLGLYFIACWVRGGQTLPMKTWRLKLELIDGSKIDIPRAALRYMLAWLSVALGGLGFLWAFVDRDRQFLHDRLASTRIVRTA